MLLKKIYCRIFQAAFALGARVLPWRKPKCCTGAGSLARLPELLKDAGCKKPMIVASRRQCAAPEFIAMMEKLPAWSGFHAVTANPRIETVEQMVRQFRAEGCDSLVAIGGGSPMDAAKAAAARLARPNRTVAQMKGLLRVRKKIVPFAAVPTTAGTGSETTIAAVVTDEAHHKYAVSDLCLIPRWAILDPELTVSLPASVTAETGMDALTHAVEAYTNILYNTKETRTLARQAVAAIFEFLPRACADGNDLQARQELLTASYRAGFAFTRASVGNVHAIAHTLGGLYDVPHGRANAVLLPVVLEEYGAAAHKRLAELADVVGLCPAGSAAEKAQAFIAAIYAMNRQLGIPADFACIRTEDLPQMAAWAEAEANPVYPVPVVFDRQRFIKVIRRVMAAH